jgi:mannose-6-phosphate isomerase-like protein (cupin superfamily)
MPDRREHPTMNADDIDPVGLAAAFASIDEPWEPRVAAELNGQVVKIAKAEGAFVWHHHAADELFFVTDGRLRIEFREREDRLLDAGDLLVVPQGIEHRPVAEEPTEMVLFEQAGTRNTGNVENDRTRTDLDHVE